MATTGTRSDDSISASPDSTRTRPRLTLAVAAKEYVWLYDHRHGVTPEAIAVREGLTVLRVRLGLERAGVRERGQITVSGTDGAALRAPRLIPFFPIVSFTPQAPCGHRTMLRKGSLFCCMVCHRSGIDGHPALVRDPRTDPAPEPKPAPAPVKVAVETRKQKRAIRFAKPPNGSHT